MSKDPDPTWLVRLVEVYSVATEEFVCEHELPPLELAALQRLWEVSEGDPLFEMFEVTEAQRPFIEAALGFALHFEINSYFLSTRCTDSDAMVREGGFMGMFAPPRLLRAFLMQCRRDRRATDLVGWQVRGSAHWCPRAVTEPAKILLFAGAAAG